jgi:alpha-D-xyloside xylohydrolase
MKFTDGFWRVRPGVNALYGQEAYDIAADGDTVVVHAPTKVIERRGDVLNRPVLTVSLSSPLDGVVGVRIDHHQGTPSDGGFELIGAVEGAGEARLDGTDGVLTAGPLTARVTHGSPWNLTFEADGRVLTSSGHKSLGLMKLGAGSTVTAEPAGITGASTTGLAEASTYLHAQLSLGVGELVYGLGERFGPYIKNGQSVDIWNSDGGTSSEQAYKNIPFYLTNRGYGVLVNRRGHVSFEVGTEAVERVQFSAPGESLEFFVIYGPTPAEILERYTTLTGRPAKVPAWSYGLWLSTSFTTDYDEETVNRFVDGMAERDIPLSVFHFDCFWMREFNWTDFEWDSRTFPDPEGMLARLHDKKLHISAWINPYIGQRSKLFREAADAGYLVKNRDGSVWQWDEWQAGMGLVDFTNPDASAWFQDKIRTLVGQGVDAIKTDFGERIPTDVAWFDGSAPDGMHNWYTQLYNRAVFDALTDAKGDGEAVLFARSATTGGQQMPVHWGGDNSSSFESMAETLRGGLSLAMSGFGFWSHDIGGFEGKPDPAVFKRWVVFGLLSSHTRLHGSTSYRVPWAFDENPSTLRQAQEGPSSGTVTEGQSAVDVTRKFVKLKLSLMPYLTAVGLEAHERGLPFMRPMQLAFPGDPAVDHLDRQYMIGDSLLVAPVFSASGEVTYYLPAGRWTDWFTGEQVEGGAWRTETHAFDSVPLWVREGSVIVTGSVDDRPDYDFLESPLVTVFPGDRVSSAVATSPDGTSAEFTVERSETGATVSSSSDRPFRVRVGSTGAIAEGTGAVTATA